MATRKEVAALAGVSEATVSRVLNGVGPIKESTRKRVREAAEKLGYQLNAVAASFARGKSGNIGVVLPHVPKVHLFSTYYFSEMLSGIGEAARASGQGLLLLYRDPLKPFDYVSLFATQRVDACLVLGASAASHEAEAIARMAEEQLPFCVVDQRYDDPRISFVCADHAEGSISATKHLLGIGCRRVGFLNGPPHYSNSADRQEGYRLALKEAGLEPDASLQFEGNYSRSSGYKAAEAVDRQLDQLDGLVCANDRMAVGLIQGLKERGRRIPEELAIVGCDNSDIADWFDPSLTSVAVPFYEMGKLAAERLMESMKEEKASRGVIREVLRTSLVVRQTSR
ncbi:LacI family DNA-binding transcriptional regulator [Cohnella lubricantis]|uniref:LacI family DNA-binding transcriptional regulator n=1 Tax=Cohnella lubricantis TaxID=2163172 RepID=A0A841TK31_9BACL|nr:LacI family DNA-binding transcriptional regulator [Cohnella lubricantis]MBB6679297.1 LacI family DNA-binding transcriptional regulator [Cohnella lubricantis]MBP2120394.1 LacI family transcriptional regulator [Cohnella lubricantis]